MQTLPTILPTANADSFNDGGAMAIPGKTEKTGVPFDHLMSRVLSPSPTEANPSVEQNQAQKNAVLDLEKSGAQMDTDSSLHQTKNSKSNTQISGKVPVKKSGGDSDASANSTQLSDTNVVAINLENVLIQPLALAAMIADQKFELNAGAKATSNSQEVLGVLSEVKNQSQPAAKVNLISQVSGQRKIAAAVEALAVAKTNPTDSKISGLTAADSQTPPSAKDVGADLTTPKLSEKSFVQLPQLELSPAPDLSAKPAPQKTLDVNGTPVAKQDVPMTKTENTDKTASSAGKILPGAAVSVAHATNLPPRENFSSLNFARAGQMAANVTANSSPSNNPTDVAPLSADSINSIASANVSDVRSRALDRVQDMVVLHATRLSDVGNDSLQVVIKPGAGTQLSLELRQRGDGVEATAILQRGDFEHLNKQWPALQQQLEQRGIRLTPLATDANFASSGENNFQQKQNQSTEPDSFPAGAVAEIAPAGLMTGAFAQSDARAVRHYGWESWA
jgi:hypothetical protein